MATWDAARWDDFTFDDPRADALPLRPLTTAERNALPAELGTLLIFNSDTNKLNVRAGSAWLEIL